MNRLQQVLLGVVLVVSSALICLIHYMIFRDAGYIASYFLGGIALLPVEVLLVTLVIHRLLSEREKRVKLQKLNMVIGAFFSEVGTALIKYLSSFGTEVEKIGNDLMVTQDWSAKEFLSISRRIKGYNHKIDSRKGDLEHLRSLLIEKRDFLLRLLENPNLLEHESFTDLLWAAFHLTDELVNRVDLTRLPAADYDHLSGDMKRAYTLLIYEWLAYMRHLRSRYPYLFSLAVRLNPFDPNASAEIKE